jgi:hypothetical protein
LLLASQEDKFSLEKKLKAKEEEIACLNMALSSEQTKAQASAAEKKSLKTMNTQYSKEIVELKLKLKDHESVYALQLAEIAQLTAALKAEQEKSGDLQIQLTRKTTINAVNVEATTAKKGEKTTTAVAGAVPEAAAISGKAEGDGRRKSILGFFI